MNKTQKLLKAVKVTDLSSLDSERGEDSTPPVPMPNQAISIHLPNIPTGLLVFSFGIWKTEAYKTKATRSHPSARLVSGRDEVTSRSTQLLSWSPVLQIQLLSEATW